MITPGMTNYQLALEAIKIAPDDPEDTLMVQLTKKDLCVLIFGSLLINTLFPEMVFAVEGLWEKVNEVSTAQEFLPRLPAS